MTVSYTAEVATCRRFGCFWKLLGRWRASIYKIIWMDILAYLVGYYAMAILYRNVLNKDQKIIFEDLVEYCRSFGALIPLVFVLGFYVSIIVDRWWNEYIAVPWPDPLAVYVSALVRGQDERGRLMRRTVMRYACLALTMVLTMISPGIKRRFPNMDYLVEAGLLNKNEASILQAMDDKFPKHPKHWMPIMWASSILTRARKEGRIWDDFSLKSMIDELNKFRGGCNMLIHYDTISIPLVYTQVVTLAVYTYFLASMFGYQWTERTASHNHIVNYYFPFFSMLEFFFFMGWLKVAETLICPFGDDDDDFELNWLIDRNLQVCYLIVDEMHNDHPELVRDQYWDEVFPNELPYNTEVQRAEPPEASTARLDISKVQPAASDFNKVQTSGDLSWVEFEDRSIEENEKSEMRIKWLSDRFSFNNFSQSELTSVINSELDTTEKDGQEEGFQSGFSTDMDEFDRLRQFRNVARFERQMKQANLTIELMKKANEEDGFSTKVQSKLSQTEIVPEKYIEKQYSNLSLIAPRVIVPETAPTTDQSTSSSLIDIDVETDKSDSSKKSSKN